MKTQVMLKLETLGQKPNSAIAAIAAVKFGHVTILDSFYQRVDPASCLTLGMRGDALTVIWWLQEKSAKPGLRLGDALRQFSSWLKDEDAEVWGNGAGFDNVVLAEAYDRAQLPRPWKWFNDRCYRTAKSLQPDIVMAEDDTQLTVLDSAKAQAKHLMALLAARGGTQAFKNPKRTMPAGRLKAADAEARAKEIRALRARGMTHQQIADELGLKRELVSSYLSSRCKAAVRAGVNQ